MSISRRRFTVAASLVPLFGLAGCCFQDIQDHVATVRSFVDTIAPIIVAADGQKKDEINQIQKEVDTAADAFAKLPNNTDSSSSTAKSGATLIISWVNEVLAIAESIPTVPPQTKAILGAVQLLLVAIAAYFGITMTPTAAPMVVGAARQPAPRLVAEATSRYQHAGDKEQETKNAEAEVRDWIKMQKLAQ